MKSPFIIYMSRFTNNANEFLFRSNFFRAIKLGDKEVEYNPNFRLILHTKLANPHYKPEMQAQTTLINFTVTRDGLEDQLLAEVVRAERPDLEELKSQLTKQVRDYSGFFRVSIQRTAMMSLSNVMNFFFVLFSFFL